MRNESEELREIRIPYKALDRNIMGTDHLGDLSIDGKIISKCFEVKLNRMCYGLEDTRETEDSKF